MSPPFVTAPALDLPGIRHGFFGRAGGVSTGLFASLNTGLGSQDDPGAVQENRARAAAALGLGPENLITPFQVHGADAMRVDQVHTAQRPRCDALLSTAPGIGLAILTADCVPVLLADAQAGVIGAAHAGWKGLLAGVLPKLVREMITAGARPESMHCAIGPCIAQASYEVGPEFVARFAAHDHALARFFVPGRGDRSQFDLAGCCAAQFLGLGLGRVDIVAADTCAHEAEYFSNRRANLRKEPDYGRNISIIALRH